MLKKSACLLAGLMLIVQLGGCAPLGGAEMALVPGSAGVEDGALNAALWEGMRLYAGVHDKTANYYQPPGDSDDEQMYAINRAVKGGAGVVVLAGQDFAAAAATAQNRWPDRHFILLDGTPEGGPEKNTVSVQFAGEQAGFLAGFGAVMEGYTRLGFIGGAERPDIIGYGLGYVQGAAAAAGVLEEDVTLRYTYAGRQATGDDIREQAAAWYREGTEVIFACGEAVNQSVFDAAGQEEGWAIGSGGDQSAVSSRVLFSTVADVSAATGRALDAHFNDSFPGGKTLRFTTADSMVGLAMDNARTRHFTMEDYLTQLSLLTEGDVRIVLQDAGGALPADPQELDIRLPRVALEVE